MPAKRKPLPRPCPQCGLTYGTCRIIVFNPKWSLSPKSEPRVILAIGHYNPEGYKLSKKKHIFSFFNASGAVYEPIKGRSSKIWHNFMLKLWHSSRFRFRYTERSRTYPLTKELFDLFKISGYPIITERAHFLKRGCMKGARCWIR